MNEKINSERNIQKSPLRLGSRYTFYAKTNGLYGEYYGVIYTLSDKVCHEEVEKFKEKPKRADLLKRDLSVNALYIKDEGDFLKVKKVIQAKSKEKNDNSIYLLFFTSRDTFAVDFS